MNLSTLTSGSPRRAYLAEYALLPLRAFLGFTFIFAGLQKLANPGFLDANNPASIQAQIVGSASRSPIGSLVGHLGEHAAILGVLIALGEVAIGAGLVVGLWTRIAALGGMALSFGLFLTVSFHASPFYTGSDIVFFFAFIPFVIAGAGTHFSLDAVIARRVAQRHGLPDPGLVAVPFGFLPHHCGQFRDGRCAAQGNAPCAEETCPILARESEPLTRRRELNDVERRTVIVGAGFAAAVAGVAAVVSAATAVIGRAIGGVATTEVTHLTTTTTVPATTSTTVPGTTSTTVAGTAIGNAADVAVGSFAEFTIPTSGEPGIVLQPQAGEFKAFNAVCPHAGCTVTYMTSNDQLVCPCHASIFNPDNGDLISGPAFTGLTELNVVERNGQLYLE